MAPHSPGCSGSGSPESPSRTTLSSLYVPNTLPNTHPTTLDTPKGSYSSNSNLCSLPLTLSTEAILLSTLSESTSLTHLITSNHSNSNSPLSCSCNYYYIKHFIIYFHIFGLNVYSFPHSLSKYPLRF